MSAGSGFPPCAEFDCCECGRHIVQICGPVTEPPLCGACQMMPGWVEDPKVRAILDPGGRACPPDLSTVPTWPGASA